MKSLGLRSINLLLCINILVMMWQRMRFPLITKVLKFSVNILEIQTFQRYADIRNIEITELLRSKRYCLDFIDTINLMVRSERSIWEQISLIQKLLAISNQLFYSFDTCGLGWKIVPCLDQSTTKPIPTQWYCLVNFKWENQSDQSDCRFHNYWQIAEWSIFFGSKSDLKFYSSSLFCFHICRTLLSLNTYI